MSTPREGTVETALFTLDHPGPLPLSRVTFHNELEASSPADFLGLTKALTTGDSRDLSRILGLLRLGAWDPTWLSELLPDLERATPLASPVLREELRRALAQVGRRVFAVAGDDSDQHGVLARAHAAAQEPA